MAKQRLYNIVNKSVYWQPDALTNSYWLSKFVNCFTHDGKAFRAENTVYTLASKFKQLYPRESFYVHFTKVIHQLAPSVTFGRTRDGLQLVVVPNLIDTNRGIKIAIRWLVNSFKKQPEHTILERALRVIKATKSNFKRLDKVIEQRYLFFQNLQESQRNQHFRWV